MGLPKPPLSWRVLDLLKVQSSPKQSRNSSHVNLSAQGKDVHKCSCCGLVVSFEEGSTKFRCSQCHTTNVITEFEAMELIPVSPPISYAAVKSLTDRCLSGPKAKNSHELHLKLQPLVDYLQAAFGSLVNLNESFKLKKGSSRARYSCSNLDLEDFRKTFDFLTILPSKRPLFCALYSIQQSIKRLPLHIADNPKNLYWLVLVFEIPFLHKALTISDNKPSVEAKSMVEMLEIRSLCYDILKRALGILSQCEPRSSGNYLASWFLKLPHNDFLQKINLINLYVTFHLKKCFYYSNNPELARRGSMGELSQPGPNFSQTSDRSRRYSLPEDDEYARFCYLKDELDEISNGHNWPHLRIPGGRSNKQRPESVKIRTFHYTLNYHLRTSAAALGIFVKANYIRNEPHKVPIYAFYNSLVDYVNVKFDFDSWLSKKRAPPSVTDSEPAVQTVIDYIKGTTSILEVENSSKLEAFFFCHYPYLISLGGKISILQYEARRQMERKAEEAFITSLDKRVSMDVYFRVRVRREHLLLDSLNCIKQNQNNLKKGIKVHFVNEAGVDLGGLKKEWFLLLIRKLLSPQTRMFHEVDDSRILWFHVIPVNDLEVYYLFGAVLGLAIYNSTILELSFPLALYKIMLGMPIGLSDYSEIFPVAAKNLLKLRDCSAEELALLDLTFEVSFKDFYGNCQERELIPDGAITPVTIENREIYIDKYAHFFISDGIQEQVLSFERGFSSIVDGNAFSLFLPEEIQLLLCGSEQGRIDVEVLKSVTQYTGWNSKEDALRSQVVNWFWNHLAALSGAEQKRVLLFITGSDRIPATGIENLALRLNRLNNGRDSNKLPVAHTCFNELAIYEYSSKEKFTKKFTQAVTMLGGFEIS